LERIAPQTGRSSEYNKEGEKKKGSEGEEGKGPEDVPVSVRPLRYISPKGIRKVEKKGEFGGGDGSGGKGRSAGVQWVGFVVQGGKRA